MRGTAFIAKLLQRTTTALHRGRPKSSQNSRACSRPTCSWPVWAGGP